MKIYIFILCFSSLLILSISYSSVIYQHDDEQGVRVYSDQPSTIEVKIKPEPVLSSAKKTQASKVIKTEKSHSHRVVNIIEPSAQQTIRNTQGIVSIKVKITPGLLDGDTIQWFMDGKLIRISAEPSVLLSNINRGAHTIQAKLYNKKKQIENKTKTVTFYLHRSIVHRSQNKRH